MQVSWVVLTLIAWLILDHVSECPWNLFSFFVDQFLSSVVGQLFFSADQFLTPIVSSTCIYIYN